MIFSHRARRLQVIVFTYAMIIVFVFGNICFLEQALTAAAEHGYDFFEVALASGPPSNREMYGAELLNSHQ